MVAVFGGAAGVVLEGISVEPVAAEELVGGTVKAVGAAFEDDVNGAAAGAAVLGVVGVGLDFELLNGVDRGDVGEVVAAGLGVVGGAVEEEFGVAVGAVYAPFGDGAVVEGALVGEGAIEVDAGDEGGEHEGVSAVEGGAELLRG